MSIAQWRQFNFFDKQQAVDPSDKSKSPAVFQKPDISVITSGRGQIALADILFIYNDGLKPHSTRLHILNSVGPYARVDKCISAIATLRLIHLSRTMVAALRT
ncbi:hypothetical protein BJV82DRAFT_64494 [Fennellomyces sp. T-0311]|nr:hypothetical protein BJV82DRAFT_64494 [Fennellomyces sp. T-0311]